VATLARQDGTRPKVWNDFYRVREACQEACQLPNLDSYDLVGLTIAGGSDCLFCRLFDGPQVSRTVAAHGLWGRWRRWRAGATAEGLGRVAESGLDGPAAGVADGNPAAPEEHPRPGPEFVGFLPSGHRHLRPEDQLLVVRSRLSGQPPWTASSIVRTEAPVQMSGAVPFPSNPTGASGSRSPIRLPVQRFRRGWLSQLG
jgi:hypothetical protein